MLSNVQEKKGQQEEEQKQNRSLLVNVTLNNASKDRQNPQSET
jgi:hypothetical protein